MKNIICIAFVLFVMSSKAQTNVYHPFPDSNAVWSEYYSNSSSWGYYLYSIFGDTTINSLTYHKVYSYSENKYSISDTVITKTNSTLIGGIREDGFKRIYFYNIRFIGNTQYKDSIVKLYDFSKQAGDTVFFTKNFPSPYAYQYLVIDSIDSVLVNHQYRKRYNLHGDDTWIEGVGSTRDLLSTIMPYPTCSCIDELICYKNGGLDYYVSPPYHYCFPFTGTGIVNIKHPESILVYPNPASTTINLTIRQAQGTNASLLITDMLGNAVKQSIIYNPTSIISVADLAEGVYNISISSNEGEVNKRLVIVR